MPRDFTQSQIMDYAQRFGRVSTGDAGWVLEMGDAKYIYQVIVTNTQEEDLNIILKTHWQRCGSIEYTHAELKNGCGLKRFPSKHFNVNAAWCSLGILTHNVSS